MTGREWTFPASFGQERIWLSQQLDPASPVYNVPWQARPAVPLDAGQWCTVFGHVVARQEALRTAVRLGPDGLVQVVRAEVPIEPEVHDLRVLPDAEEFASRLGEELARQPIPLDGAPLWRLQLCRLGDADWLVTFVVHHAVFDAASVPVFDREFSEACDAVLEGREPRLPELPIHYADYAVWQRGQLTSTREQLAYWRERLAGLPPVHALPTDRPRPAALDFAGDQIDFALPAGLPGRVRELARELAVSPFMVLLAGHAALVARLSRQDDVVIGVPLAGRDLPELAPLIGMFVNQVAIRLDCSGEPSTAELAGRVRDAVLDAIEHGQVPFQVVADEVRGERDPAVQPLYQLGFNHIPDSGLETIRHTTAKDDLAIDLTADGGRLLYRTGLFDRATAEAFLERYLRLLDAALREPSRPITALPLLSDAERAQVLRAGTGPVTELPAGTVVDLVGAQVRRTPDALAVDLGGRQLTYAELDAHADRVAHRLHALGAGPGTVVGLCLPNSVELVTGVLGVLKSGAAYVPLDPDLPAPRRELILADAGALCVLDRGWFGAPDALVTGDPRPSAGPADLAYVLYTSGSTGRPKGVQVEHRSVVAYLDWARRAYPGLAGRALLHTSASFDLTVTTLLGPLVAGGSIVDGGDVTFVKATPTHLTVLPAVPSADLVLGGEALTGEALGPWRARHPGVTITNEYGPTEATVGCVAARIAPGEPVPPGPVPIGRPVANARAYVLDDRLRPVPPGVAGQLYVAGPQVARGYLGRREQTDERFTEDPFAAGERMYATGDLARWRHDGTLGYLGRVDDQIKLRGHRIEPGEIEAALRELPGVRDAAVAVRDGRLVGYLVGAADCSALTRILPGYLVPEVVVLLDALPVAPSGKLDRAALPAPEPGERVPYVVPRTAAEELVAEVLGELLGVEKVGVHDDFFTLGGNSLLAIRAANRLREQTGVDLGVRVLFGVRTVAELAAELERRIEADLGALSDDDLRRMLDEEGQR
ncbi:amino acid adenylation domain-containing protein [Streptomyces sp. MN03-5084-2B]|nr:amino acid adenylation domain-containing protein [Streptomyces sp. MN03-5084-2B]